MTGHDYMGQRRSMQVEAGYSSRAVFRLFWQNWSVQGRQVLTMIVWGHSAYLSPFNPCSGVVVKTRRQLFARKEIAKIDGENKVHFLTEQARAGTNHWAMRLALLRVT